MARLDKYIRLIEQALSQTLAKRGIPSPELVEAIAVAKISLVELKQEVGSFALMEGTGFEQLDFITMCKFAEGDSRILQSKLCRDAVRAKSAPAGRSRVESELLGKLKSSQGQDWALTFQMADAVCERTIDQWVADKDARL
jgi:acyl-CoA oxidase